VVLEGNSRPEQWSSGFALKSIRQRNRKPEIYANLVGMPAVAAWACRLGLCAKMFTHRGSNSNDCSNDLMARNERVLAEAPVTVNPMDVAVADTTVRDFDLDFIGLQFFRGEIVRQQMRTCCIHGKTVYLAHFGLCSF